MKPSIIASHESEINSFKYSVLKSYSDFAAEVCKYLEYSVDERELAFKKQQLILLGSYVDIIIYFLSPTNESDENCMTTDEFYEVVRKFNKITDTFYWIDLN